MKKMQSLTELYKIGRGPSSSHTMGPEKACMLFKAKYDTAMAQAREVCAAVNKPEDVAPAAQFIKSIDHALTSEKESTAMLKARISELGIVWNKANRTYEYKAE